MEAPKISDGKPGSSMNSGDARQSSAAQLNGASRGKCLVCGDPIGEQCFCKLHPSEGAPVMFCCPSCAIQYLESTRTPADSREAELRGYEKSTHFFIGVDKPWL